MGVVRTLHAGGNYRHLHPLVEEDAVDAIEADVWVVRGRVVAHHERPLWWLPLHLDKRGLHVPLETAIDLDELFDVVDGHAALVLDLRSWWADPVPGVVRALLEERPNPPEVSATCEAWGTADRLRAWLPELRSAYSIRSEQQLRRYVQGRAAAALPPAPVAIRHSLLHDEADVEALHRYCPRISAWTVDDVDRALTLARWGVDEIVSNHLDVLRAL